MTHSIDFTTAKPIPDAAGYYATAAGQIVCVTSGNPIVLSGTQDGSPYRMMSIPQDTGGRLRRHRHVLVCMAFHGPKPGPEYQARHLNRVLDDDRAENMAWRLTTDVQSKQARADQCFGTGSHHLSAKLTADDVLTIRERAAAGVAQHALATEYGISPSNVSCIVAGHTWAHVPQEAA